MTRLQLSRLVLILGALTAFSSMSIDMYLPAFPRIASNLNIPLGTVQLSISAFLFGSAAGQLFYGPLADRWGRRAPLLLGLAIYISSAVGCACVHTGEALIFWRVVMAVGGGAGMVISRAVVRDIYGAVEAARMFSLLMLVMGAAADPGPLRKYGGERIGAPGDDPILDRSNRGGGRRYAPQRDRGADDRNHGRVRGGGLVCSGGGCPRLFGQCFGKIIPSK